MAAPIGTIYLQSPWLILSGTSSSQNITVVTKGFQLGKIEQIWTGSYRSVGDIVQFPLEKVIIINDGENDFFVVNEYTLIYQEPLPV